MSFFSDEFKKWINSNNKKPVTLVEADHSAGTVLVSDGKYITRPWDESPNTPYLDLMKGNVRMKREFAGSSVGMIKLSNEGGDIDDWINYKWEGHSIRIYYGDQRWNRSRFQLITVQQNGGIGITSHDILEWLLFDRDEMLDREIGSDTDPITIGKVYNAEAKLTDAIRQIYSSNDGAMESFTCIKDNGVKLTEGEGYTVDRVKGNFRLLNSVAGRITFDGVQKDKTAGKAIANILDRIDVPYDSADLINYPNKSEVGLYVNSATSVRKLLDTIKRSVGGESGYNKYGKYKISRRESPGEPVLSIDAGDIKNHSFRFDETVKPKKKITFGYKKNWSVQTKDELGSSLTITDKELLSTEYQEYIKENNVQSYPGAEDSYIESAIYGQLEAEAEGARIALLNSQDIHFYRFTASFIALELWQNVGKTILVTYPRYGFESGLPVILESIEFDLSKQKVEIKVWR